MEKKPLVDHNLEGELGWILPNGDFYSCQKYEHDNLADNIFSQVFGVHVENASRLAEKSGWIKITQIPQYSGPQPLILTSLTQKQIDTFFDWCQKHNRPFPRSLIEAFE